MTDRGRLVCLLVPVALLFGYLSWQVLGPSGLEADVEACDYLLDLDTPFYSRDATTLNGRTIPATSLDEGMKAWGNRAQHAAGLAADGELKAALARFSRVALSKTWDDSEAGRVPERAFLRILGLCPH